MWAEWFGPYLAGLRVVEQLTFGERESMFEHVFLLRELYVGVVGARYYCSRRARMQCFHSVQNVALMIQTIQKPQNDTHARDTVSACITPKST
jgi:hypothetical protein